MPIRLSHYSQIQLKQTDCLQNDQIGGRSDRQVGPDYKNYQRNSKTVSKEVQAERNFLGVAEPPLCRMYFQSPSAYKETSSAVDIPRATVGKAHWA